MQNHLDILIKHIEQWRQSHGMPENLHGQLFLVTDKEDFSNLFSDPNNSEKVMVATRCPKFKHSIQISIPNIPGNEAQTIKIGDANVVFSVTPLNH